MSRRTIGVSIAMLLVAWPLAAQQPSAPASPTPSIVTIGEATIRRAPDQAFVTVSVESRAKMPRDAQRQNAETMTAVQQRIADAGIAKDAVRTTGYSIQQEFDYANGRRIPREYVARNGIEIRVDAIERTGEILDLTVQAGATSVQSVRFDLKDRNAVERDALLHAVEDARARAEAMAAGAGRTLDRILRIDDTREPQVIAPQPRMMTARAASEPTPTPIETGLIEVHAQVTLTVAMK